MKTADHLLNTALALTAVCALGTSALVIDREFELGIIHPASASPIAGEVSDWQRYGEAGHKIGPSDAPVVVVVFADYQCPYCAILNQTLHAVRTHRPADVKTVFRHFPLRVNSDNAAMAAECAGAQGRFLAYHDALYASGDSISVISWRRFGERVGVPDLSRLDACIDAGEFRTQVEEDRKAAVRLGGQGTPMMLVNDKLVYGALSQNALEELVSEVLEASR